MSYHTSSTDVLGTTIGGPPAINTERTAAAVGIGGIYSAGQTSGGVTNGLWSNGGRLAQPSVGR